MYASPHSISAHLVYKEEKSNLAFCEYFGSQPLWKWNGMNNKGFANAARSYSHLPHASKDDYELRQ